MVRQQQREEEKRGGYARGRVVSKGGFWGVGGSRGF